MIKNALIIFLIVATLTATAQIKVPQPSPAGSVSTVVGLTDIKIEYSRPTAKGRKIFGKGDAFLVPFGKMWRTGANSGTTVTFSDDIKFAGVDVPKGTYLVLTIPEESEWTVILYNDVAMGGNLTKYDETKDQVRTKVKSARLSEMVETMTFQITDLTADSKSANLQLSWEHTAVSVPISVDFDKEVMASIKENTVLNPNNLAGAANYYLNTGKDLKQALAWITEACVARPTAYWMMHSKAKIQKALGDKKGALVSANASKEEALKQSNNDYVKMNDELISSLK